ncbi:MAG: hypothetical protein MK073_03655 [Phycisphaerales bacterium]|nr:hypothetical protein [Phycisphaerales bacterium]
MKSTIAIGNTSINEFEVTQSMAPTFHGQQVHPVCSTWDLAHQFELAARYALEPHLEAHEQGIGAELCIKHLKPAPIGKTVVVCATISSLDSTTVVCDIEAKVGDSLIATGSQVQRVLPSDKIRDLIQNAEDA